MALKTNYVDDVLDSSMSGKYRYTSVENSDGTVSFTDSTTYSQKGDEFGAKEVNAICEAVNTNTANIATNTANIATNTGNIATLKGALKAKFVDYELNAGLSEVVKETDTYSSYRYSLDFASISGISAEKISAVIPLGFAESVTDTELNRIHYHGVFWCKEFYCMGSGKYDIILWAETFELPPAIYTKAFVLYTD